MHPALQVAVVKFYFIATLLRAETISARPFFCFFEHSMQQDKSADAISDEELLFQFRKIEQLPAQKKKLVKEFLDAFIFKNNLQKQLTQ
jgi:hypothetical protein